MCTATNGTVLKHIRRELLDSAETVKALAADHARAF
jgi:hypothetical protein